MHWNATLRLHWMHRAPHGLCVAPGPIVPTLHVPLPTFLHLPALSCLWLSVLPPSPVHHLSCCPSTFSSSMVVCLLLSPNKKHTCSTHVAVPYNAQASKWGITKAEERLELLHSQAPCRTEAMHMQGRKRVVAHLTTAPVAAKSPCPPVAAKSPCPPVAAESPCPS